MIVIGLMSGTSADATDAAVCAIEGGPPAWRVQLLAHIQRPHPEALRAAIFRAFDPQLGTVEHLTALHVWLGEAFAQAALQAAEAAGLGVREVDLVASHGQTVYHLPPGQAHLLEGVPGLAGCGATLQLGEAAVIAERLGVPVVSNFRACDLAAGGQGAPLVPFFDWAVLRSHSEGRAVQNLGGIGNVTYLPPEAALDDVCAFDTGPGNMMIDAAAQALFGQAADWEGRLAARGQVDVALLQRLLEHPFLAVEPPKSTGREQFGAPLTQAVIAGYTGSKYDLLATVTAFTAHSVAASYARFVRPRGRLDRVIVGGGGSRNPTLLRMLAVALEERFGRPLPIAVSDAFGVPSAAKEAMAFALLGYETWHGRPSNVPSATGARHAVVLGAVVGRKGA